MKKMKKFFALALAMCMVLSMTVNALADEPLGSMSNPVQISEEVDFFYDEGFGYSTWMNSYDVTEGETFYMDIAVNSDCTVMINMESSFSTDLVLDNGTTWESSRFSESDASSPDGYPVAAVTASAGDTVYVAIEAGATEEVTLYGYIVAGGNSGPATLPSEYAGQEDFQLTIPAGTDNFYSFDTTYVAGKWMTVEGNVLTYRNETLCAATNGVADFAMNVGPGEFSSGALVQFVNEGASDVTVTINTYYPAGSAENPEAITDDASKEFPEYGQMYYYKYTAAEAGTLTIKVSSDSTYTGYQGNFWAYSVSIGDEDVESFYSTDGHSDTKVLEVTKGQEIVIGIQNSYSNDWTSYPAAKILLDLELVTPQPTPTPTPTPETGDAMTYVPFVLMAVAAFGAVVVLKKRTAVER